MTRAAVPHAGKWLVAIGVTLGSVIELIDTSIVNVALNHISANLGVAVDEVAWVTVGYILASVIVLPMTGWFASYFGRKRYFTASIIIFTVASFFCGAAGSLNSLVFWRVVQGLGGGALISTAQAILFDTFPPEERTLAAAIFGLGMMVGPAIGPTLGGMIVDRFQWPWIFYINIPVGIIATLVIEAYVHDAPEHHRAPGKIDFVGFALLAIGVGSLQFVLERGEHYEWFDSRLITGLTLVAVTGLLTMIWWELRVKDPVLDLRVLKDRSLASGTAFGVVLGMGLYGSIFALPLFAQRLLGYTAQQTGFLLLPGAIGAACAMGLIARVGTKVDGRWIIALGSVILAGSMFGHSQFNTDTSRQHMDWVIAARGVGTGFMFVPLSAAALARLRGRALGQGAAIFNLARQLGGSIGIAVLATMLTRLSAVYRATLTDHVTMYDPASVDRLSAATQLFLRTSPDSATASSQALQAVSLAIDGQSALLAYQHIFRIAGIAILLSIPLVFFLDRPQRVADIGH